MSLQEEMTPILNVVGRELIAATPEHWQSAELTLEVTQRSKDIQGVSHLISSPEGHRDIVTPTEELMSATHNLVRLCESHQQPFQALKFVVSQDEAEGWRFHSNWSYSNASKGRE